MKVTVAIFTSLFLLARHVSAHPFIIVAHITPAAVLPPTPTHNHVPRQNLLSDLESAANSVFGLPPDSSTTSNRGKTTSSASVRTVIPPATAAATTSSQSDDADSDDDDDDDTSTSSDASSTTQTSTVSPTTSTSSSSLSTSRSNTTASATGATQVTATPATSSGDSGGVPAGGVAVAVIMSLLAVLVAAWLVFKYHPKCQAWYAAREAKKFQERSYRDAIDGPGSGSQAMGAGVSRRHTILKSFFAPTTAKLGGGQEIRRKPVNWGAGSTHTSSIRAESPELPPLPIDTEKIPHDSGEKIPMTAAAAPMGQIERYSYMPPSNARQLTPSIPAKIPEHPPKTPTGAVSPLSMRADDDLERLPPISPLSHRGSHRAAKERTLPSLPPVPTIPSLNLAKRGSDGLFRLA